MLLLLAHDEHMEHSERLTPRHYITERWLGQVRQDGEVPHEPSPPCGFWAGIDSLIVK